MDNNKYKSRSSKNHKNSIPDYDWLFDDNNVRQGRGENKSKFMRRLIRLNFKSILLSLFVYIFQAAPTYVTPILTAEIINIVTVSANVGMTQEALQQIIMYIIIIAICIFTNVPTTVLRWKIVSKMLRRTSAGMRSALVRKLQSLSITYHKDMQTGKVQAKFLKDMETVDAFFSCLINNILLNAISVVIYTIIAFSSDWRVALFFMVVIPVNVMLTNTFRKSIRKAYHEYRVDTEKMSARMTRMLEMFQVTKSHGIEEVEITSVNSTIEKVEGSGKKVDSTVANFGAWSYVVNHLLSIVSLAFCSILAMYDQINVGDIVLFQSMFTSISGCVSMLINSMPQISSGSEAVRSISELMHVSDVERNMGSIKVPKISGDVRFENVTYRYPNTDVDIIKNLSLDVKAGECIAVVGPSGSGKSTLINMIIGFLPPSSGEIYIDNKHFNDYNLSDYRHNISVVPQNSILFSGTIRENITYGLEKYSEEQLQKVVEMANLNEFLKDLPQGIDTNIGEHGDKLSGGQRQRITIARALIRNPRILILDEATSALDNISELHVQKAIASSVKGRTTFIVAHRLSTIRDADRIIVIEEGKCVESGTFEELMALKGKFFELKNLSELKAKEAEQALA